MSLKEVTQNSKLVEETKDYIIYEYQEINPYLYIGYSKHLDKYIAYNKDVNEARYDLQQLAKIKLNTANHIYLSSVENQDTDIQNIVDSYFPTLRFLSFPENLNQNTLIEKVHDSYCHDFECWSTVKSLWYLDTPFMIQITNGDDSNEWITDAYTYEKAFEYILASRIKLSDEYVIDASQPMKEMTLIGSLIIELNKEKTN